MVSCDAMSMLQMFYYYNVSLPPVKA